MSKRKATLISGDPKLTQGDGCAGEESSSSRVMLVTGGSSGLGSHIVAHFAAAGWTVAALARGKDKLDAACAHANAHAYCCDVSDKSQVLKSIGQVLDKFKKIDVLVNNAAVSHDGKNFWELQLDDIDRLVDVNLKGTMYVTHTVLSQAMIPANEGFIFGVASVAGTWGIPNESCYVASKHGMVGFLDTVANETRNTGVCVSTVCPGGIDTPWWRSDHPYGKDSTHDAGTTSELIQTQEIVDLLEFQLAQPKNRVFKRVVLFPKGEWH